MHKVDSSKMIMYTSTYMLSLCVYCQLYLLLALCSSLVPLDDLGAKFNAWIVSPWGDEMYIVHSDTGFIKYNSAKA